ncbi:MAG: hypothetical protein CMF72_20150 [Mameliella sp.]|nr:hypothetical protein [Mameliella sp.]|tara:strand:- start:1817 stop:2059 length:243 start_codon:yes stop_codon:yes gene_type:complete
MQVAVEWESAWINDPDGYTNVRSGPGTNHPIVLRIDDDEEIEFCETSGSWWEVFYEGEQEWYVGYMHKSRIVLDEDGDQN